MFNQFIFDAIIDLFGIFHCIIVYLLICQLGFLYYCSSSLAFSRVIIIIISNFIISAGFQATTIFYVFCRNHNMHPLLTTDYLVINIVILAVKYKSFTAIQLYLCHLFFTYLISICDVIFIIQSHYFYFRCL